jgi:rhodanese-related sulfurtransferase
MEKSMKTNPTQIVTALALTGILALLPACWPFDKKTVPSNEAEQSLYVINVLDKESYDDCRIAGSINVPFDQVETFAKDLDRSAELVVYCANYMCTASMAAAQKLKDMGFENVWAYEGGTAEWYQMNMKSEGKYPVEGACQASYLSAANEKPADEGHPAVAIISAEELHQKMASRGILAQASAQEAPQQAAA